MSEKIYAWLLRLFPARFRETYGDEALQLFRDRSRDEAGFLPRMRLWLDLLSDLALSVPREYFYAEPELTGFTTQMRSGGGPSFFILTEESPRPGALVFASLLSLAAVASFPFLLSHGGNDRTFGAPNSANENFPDARHPRFSGASPQAEADSVRETMREPQQENAANTAAAAGEDGKLDPAERERVIAGVIANVKQHYVERDVAEKMAEAVAAHDKRGDYNGAKDGGELASLLTKQLRRVSLDRHLEVVYSEPPLPRLAAEPSPEEDARYREAMERQNCTIEKVEILANHVGYLKLNAFPAWSVCEGTAAAAMKRLNQADALIFDLRDNHGGEPETVQFMAAYLFDHPEYWYNPRENTTRESWTRSPVPGSRLADKPVYVLTSERTASGAEQFCYDLKMLKRATIVGERTRGAAHAGVWHRIDDHFGMGIPETKAINPYAQADWAEVGVEPDVKVSAAEALKVAQELASKRLREK